MNHSKELPLDKFLTGHFASELEPNPVVSPDSEIEKGEWVLYPDGNIQKAFGEKHENGGIKMVLPDGAKIVTNAIKLGGDNAKRLSKEYGIKVSAKDTYAQAIDKYSKKVGLDKIVKDQASYFKALEDLHNNTDIDSNTALVNEEFLSGKINNLERSKKDAERELITFFSETFDLQESYKQNSDKDYDNETFKYGGVSHNDLKIVADRLGITLDEVIAIRSGKPTKKPVKFGVGGIKKYNEGGGKDPQGDIIDAATERDQTNYRVVINRLRAELRDGTIDEETYKKKISEKIPEYDFSFDTALTKDPKLREISFNVAKLSNALQDGISATERAQRQSKEGVGYGKIKTKEDFENYFQEQLSNFNKGVTAFMQENNYDTVADLAEAMFEDFKDKPNGYASLTFKKFQEAVLKDQENQVNYILNNPQLFSEDAVKEAENFRDNEMYIKESVDGKASTALTDGMLGNFSATRFGMSLTLATPDDLKTLKEAGITNTNQLTEDKLKELEGKLSEDTLEYIKAYRDNVGENDPGYVIGEVTPSEPPADLNIKPDPRSKVEMTGEYVSPEAKLRGPGYYPYHNPRSIPLNPAIAQQVNLGEIDPYRVKYEPNYAAQRQAMDNINRSGLSAQQRAAAISALTSNQQMADVQGQMQAAMATNQNYMQADQYNIQARDRQNMLNTQLQGQYFRDVQDNLDDYRFNQMRRDTYQHLQNMQHYQQYQRDNMYASLFDYGSDALGNIEMDPRKPWFLGNTPPKTYQ